jgi:molybdate transport system substrate-binding protein
MRRARTIALLLALLLLHAASAASAEEIRVLTSGGFAAALAELTPRFERTAQVTVAITEGGTLGNGPDSIPSRLQRGEPADVLIMSAAALDDLIKAGKVASGSRVDLGRSGIGMAVKAGAAKPDIHTVAALKQTLLDAKSIAVSSSISGVYLRTELFERLGIAPHVLPKTKTIETGRVGTAVARGEAEIGFQQTSELVPLSGIDYVGPLPAEVQRITVFAAGIVSGAANAGGARRLIEFLASAAARDAIRRSGLDPLGGDSTAGQGQGRMYGLIGKLITVDGERDALIAILLQATARMPGCRSYIVAKDNADPNGLWITEVWDSKESHDASLSLPSVRDAIARGRPLIARFESSVVTEPVGF